MYKSNKHGNISYSANAVVTGAGSGIGRAFCVELARRGSSVVCSDISLVRAQETAELAMRLGVKATAVACDVAEREHVESLCTTASEFFGAPPSLVVNNAGVAHGGRLIGDIGFDDWYWVLGINLFGVVHGCEIFAPVLRGQNRGGIINIASAASFTAAPIMGPYSASKAAVLSISETLAAEMSGTNVNVTVVCPTFVDTDIAENGRIAPGPAEFARKRLERGTAPEVIAAKALNANDKGRLYVVPQVDARVIWLLKRLAPGIVTRALSFGAGLMGIAATNSQSTDERM